MPLLLRHTEGFGRDQFSVFEGERYIGRIYKTMKDDWYWGLDWFTAGQQSINGHAATREEATAWS